MIRNVLIAGALILPLACVAATASAEESRGCSEAPKANSMTEHDAKAKGMDDRYEVRGLGAEGDCNEVDTREDGARVQAGMNPSRRTIIGDDEGEE
jgi:hypothetical protein